MILTDKHDLYLSPHYDDICFSLGNYVAGRGEGTMLGIFSRSAFLGPGANVVAPGIDDLSPELRIETVTSIRRGEDESFAAFVGLRTFYCNLDEAPVRGRWPFDATCVYEDTRCFSATIMDEIRALLFRARGHSPALYCPIGIGGHVDHLIVRNTVIDNLAELFEICAVCFYEELPYASDVDHRTTGLRDFFKQISPRRPRRQILPVRDPCHKLGMIGIYSSQFPWAPPSFPEFTPVTTTPPCPMHEALWML